MSGHSCHRKRAREHTHARTPLRSLSALATGRRASAIGLLSALGCLLFALFAAAQVRKFPKTAEAAAEMQGHEGLGRDRPGCAVDTEERDH